MCHRYASIGVYRGLGWCFSQYANLHKNSDTMHHFLHFLFCGKNIWFSLCGFPPRYIGWAAASYLGNTSFMGTKKDKRYACIVFLQLSLLNFSLCLVARFKALSNSSLRTNNEYICIFLFFSFHCLSLFVWRCAGCCRSLLQKVWGERCLSHVIVHSHPHTHCSHCCK